MRKVFTPTSFRVVSEARRMEFEAPGAAETRAALRAEYDGFAAEILRSLAAEGQAELRQTQAKARESAGEVAAPRAVASIQA